MGMHRWLLLSASELARLVREGEARSEAIVRVHVERVREVNGRLNAMVADRFEEALAEARAADARVAAGEPLPPLLGVPCTIKESFALAGMPNTAGLVSRRGVRATSDAAAVTRLREAGAIPLGVTNTSELCMWMESSNRVWGRTNNPYDPRRIVGGSSGGEGAIVASGASPLGLGSDIGGSIRMPAFFNGVFGHKPSSGVVPNEGQFPLPHGRGLRLLATGPLCRRAEDLWLALSVMADPGTLAGDPAAVEVGELVVLDVQDNGRLRVSASLRAAQRRAAEALARRGAVVRRFRSPLFARSLEMWAAHMAEQGGPSFAELMGGGVAVHAWRELGRWLRGRSEHTLPAIGLALIERAAVRVPGGLARLGALADELRATIEEALGERGVMLYPSYPRTAPRHHWPLLFPVEWMYTAVFNALELPVTQVPLGLDARGLPLGVQVVGAHGRDALTIAVARALEEELGGWVPPVNAGRA